ncbi:AbfB domain-containing protein [Verrucosispora sp. NA02020]|uniref:AbfB domain-containing protein n=1 Tax=Verrucosispora sp. NA02020 TaxID=2742132 RepID=UPI001590AD07|nr:AbfB domain-containing protein [Verrucosispora sp. NA02020]QKW13844.1 AbfB domain-containing protein [Verrucosispora sp. NA02020]
MSEKGTNQPRLRIGGWLSPSDSDATPTASVRSGGGRHDRPADLPRRSTPSPLLPRIVLSASARPTRTSAEAGTVSGPALAGDAPATDLLPPPGGPHRPDGAGAADVRRKLLLCGVAVVAVSTVVGATALYGGDAPEPVRGEFAAAVPGPDVDGPPFGPGDPGAITPSAATGVPTLSPGAIPTTDGGGASVSRRATAAPTSAGPVPAVPPPVVSVPASPSSTPTAPAGTALTPGTRIGLEVAALPGRRVRHAGFQAQVDAVDAGSSAGARADSGFVVRTGLAGACLSFESVNFPGHYLRHHEFRVFLHRAEGGDVFRADATFCQVGGIGGTHTSLRSYNYPNRYLRHDGQRQMQVSPIGDGASASSATFVVRPAL